MKWKFWVRVPEVEKPNALLAQIEGKWKVSLQVHPVWPWIAEMQPGPLWELYAASRGGEHLALGKTQNDLLRNIIQQEQQMKAARELNSYMIGEA